MSKKKKHEVWCENQDHTYKTKGIANPEYWYLGQYPSYVYTRCSWCRTVLEVEELPHPLYGKKK